jgi:signal transduction histidine kinase
MNYINQMIPIEVVIFSGITHLVLGIYIYLFAYKLYNKNYIAAKYMSYICFAVFNWILWIIVQDLYIISLENVLALYLTNVLIYFSFITIIQSFVFFAISFNNTKISKKYNFLNYPYILSILLIFIPQIGIFRLDTSNPIAYNSISYYILFSYAISYCILYIKIFIDKYNAIHNENIQNNIQLFLTLPILGLFLILISNIIIPAILQDTNFIYYGPIFILMLIVTIFISIFKYKLFYINLPVANLLITLIVTIILLIMRFSLIDNSILRQLQTNILFTFIFAWIYIFLTREVYIGLKKQILLNTKKKELEIALDSKNNFLQNSSHQFRTPLTVILGYLGMVINKENPKYELNQLALEDLNKTYISAKNLNEIINDVLAANDVNTGKFGIRIQDNVDLKKLMQSIIIEKKELLHSKSTKVDLKSKGKNTLANIDSAKVKEAINNIFDNAVFYGKGQIDILIDYELKDFFSISIKDNGVGITAADAKKIWKKFERGKKSSQINPNGSGLGLYLAKQIINQHGGEITVDSDGFNKGSNFILTIPKNISLDLKQ